MTDKEKAEEYANKNVPIDTFGFRSLDDVHYDVKQAFLAGLKAGKDMAEVDLAKAKEIIKDYLTIVKGSHTTVCGVSEENRTIYVLKLNKEAEQFLRKSE